MGKPSQKKTAKRKAKLVVKRKSELARVSQDRSMQSVLDPQVLTPTRPMATLLQELDELLLDEQGRFQVVPSSVYEGLDRTELRLWCGMRAIYSLPTTELVEYLRKIIGERTAIEVGSGNGVLGRALGIPMTDSMNQRWPEVAFQIRMMGQVPVQYGEDVLEMNANDAVKHFNPQVVVGAWVTHWIDPNRPFPEGGGSMYGLHEELILDHPSVETYMVVGNEHIHRGKTLLRRNPQIIKAPWIHSRAARPELDCLYVWESK